MRSRLFKSSRGIVLAAIAALAPATFGAEAPNVPAFPGAEGYGASTRGGRGGQVIAVTNLNDSGPGSLREAVEAKGPRTIVFRVSGTIDLKNKLEIRHPFITIAGQTAPGDGICIKGYPFSVGADEVIIRYLRVRFGPESGTSDDAVQARYQKNIVVDHVSASWSVDEALSVYHCQNLTVQWCLISESLNDAHHEKGGPHGFGGIWGGDHTTYHHNLLANNSSRNPRFASACGHTDFRNNVIYNWGYNSTYGGEVHQQGRPDLLPSVINMVANYYKPGPATEAGEVRHRIANPLTRNGVEDLGKWYVGDNVVEGDGTVTADNWNGGVQPEQPDYLKVLRLNEPWPAAPIRQQPAAEAYEAVLRDAGATLPKRDAVDTRVIDEARRGVATYEGNSYKKQHKLVDPSKPCGIIDSPADVGGWPELKSLPAPADSDGDGMPDEWEIKFGLDPNNPADGKLDSDNDGYPNLDEYLNGTDPKAFADYSLPRVMLRRVDDTTKRSMKLWIPLLMTAIATTSGLGSSVKPDDRPRVLVTTDGEIDDECSLVRFLLYANEWDVEGIITTSSQYHWQGHKWAGDDWVQPYLDAYAKVYPNLIQHDPRYPTPQFLQSRTLLGNTKAEGEMEEVTPGSERIVEVLLDDSDPRPIWIQAWGGPNTIARALKTIEEQHPQKMAEVAKKIRFYFIWEQDDTYQRYIRPHWGRYGIPTIISDQFIAIFYHWKKYIPADKQAYLVGSWMKSNILENHGPLCALYQSHKKGEEGFDEGDFRSEGDSPSFLHSIPTGLRNMESPDWGGWGGRFVRVRDNTWLDPVLESGYRYPEGRWYGDSAWGRNRLKKEIPNDAALTAYLEPQWRWLDALQNDFAARADWCVKSYSQANHPPVVKLAHASDMKVRSGDKVLLSAKGTMDPDDNALTYQWWRYAQADTFDGTVEIANSRNQDATLVVPEAKPGQTIHVICEVTDDGTPHLTRYQRVILTVTE